MTIRSRVLSLVLLSISLIATGASAPVTPSAIAAGGDTCATATVIASLPYNDSGDTTNATNTPLFLNTTCAGSGMVTRPGPDLVYSITVFPGNSLTLTLTPVICNTCPPYDPTLYVIGGSCSSGSGCVVESDTGAEGVAETIGPRTFTPGTYYVYVDSIYAPGEGPDHGPYTLSVTGTLGVPNNTNFYTLTPCRILDTRRPMGTWGGPALDPGQTRDFPIAGQCNVPSTAKSVSVNVTVTQPTGDLGYLKLFPGGTPPNASTINFRAGQTRANNAIEPLSATGSLSVTNGPGTTQFILDVNGYFQ